MPTIQLHMHQQDFSHTNLCLGAKLQCLAMIGWVWHWLGLAHYKSDSFKSKTVWLNQQLSAMMHANKQALKFINKSTQHNKHHTAGKELVIPIGNHVLLCDHPEGCNKIQNRYKSDVYVMVGHHNEPNVYYIRLLDSDKKAHPKVVN